MSSNSVIFVNDVDLEVRGNPAAAIARWSAGGEFRISSMAVPGSIGTFVHAGALSSPERDVQFSVIVRGADLAEREANVSALRELLAGMVELRFADAPHLALHGFVTSFQPRGVKENGVLSFVIPDLVVDVVVSCSFPLRTDVGVQIAAVGPQPMPIPCGPLPCAGELWIYGAATNPIARLRSAGGTVIAELGFTVALGSSDMLAIDLLRLSVRHVTTAGVVTNGLPYWTSGEWFALDPRDGTPTLEIETAQGALHYRRSA